MSLSSLVRTSAVSIVALVASVPAFAATNLLSNGSFESYGAASGSFTGWTNPSVSPGKPVQASTAGNVDPFTASSDAAGTSVAYFSDDNASESLSQTISLVAGTKYEIGFDTFKVANGALNPVGYTVTAAIGGTTLVTASSANQSSGVWYHNVAQFVATTTATVSYVLAFMTNASGIAQDVYVDLAYVSVISTPTAVPEPASIVLLGTGLAGLYAARRRRQA